MPILGSSSVSNTGNAGGPTGNTGNTGPTGATGNSGLTKGATGFTGIYIKYVNSFLDKNEIQFISNDASVNITLFGFTGPTGGVHDTTGVSAAYNTNYKTPFYRVNGFTLDFYGISAGTGMNITSDGNKITVTYQPGNTPYTLYPQSDKLAFIQTTSVNGGNTGTLGSRIHVSSDNKVLNFGLTGNPSGVTFAKLFSNLNEGITFVNSVSVSANGGITLDLTQGYSNYWLTTPIGITAFKGHTFTDIRQEYTLMFDGGYVWNLPKTLFLLNADIKNYSFLDGLNILHVWSDNGGVTYNGTFIERGIGYGTSSILPGGQAKGSCCIPDADGSGGTCNDEVTRTACIAAGGVFKALIPCSRRGESICTGGGKSLKSSTEGACCCGNTGCVDSSNKPSNVLAVDKAFCDVIGGKFYLQQTCGTIDKWPNYVGRVSNTDIYGAPFICHSCEAPALACCRPDATHPTGFTCSQETGWYCTNVLGGTPFDSQLCDSSFCQSQLQTGWCRVGGVVTANVQRRNCISCGVFSASAPPGPESPAPTLTITTPKPLIRIVSSTSNSAINQTSYSSSLVGTSYLGFTINGTGLYKITGEIEVLDTASAITPKKYSIWDPAGCLTVSITQGGTVVTQGSSIGSGNCELRVTGKGCSDSNFNGKLTLTLESCADGVVSTTQKIIDLVHTDSPCTCLAFANGDVINKKPIVVPFSADRYCIHCTKKELSTDKYYSHVPYPLKRQTGIITICPPTGLSGTSCGMISSFCVTYDPIQELNGCTYSSRFDSNDDNLILDQVYNGAAEGNTLPANCYHAEYNAPGSGTTYFHKYDPQEAFYPEEIEFARQWFAANPGQDDDHPVDAAGNDIPLTRRQFNTNDYKKHHVRLCTSNCKKSVMVFPVDCDAKEPDTCDTDAGYKVPGPSEETRAKCRTCPGQSGTWFTALEARGIERILSNPYFNQLFFDEDALKYIGNVYGLDPYYIQWKLHRELEKYGSLFDPSKGYMDHITTNINTQNSEGWALLTPEQQQALLIDPLADVGGSAIDSDDQARQSCVNCSSFFQDNIKIQIPEPDFSVYTYSTYGLVLEKIKQCGVDGGVTADSSDLYCGRGGKSDKVDPGMSTIGNCTDEINKYCNKQKQIQKDLKYYLFIVKQNKTVSTDNCVLVYDLAQQRILYGGELGNGIFGTAFCRGGDIICPLDCEVPVKIREVAWFGDLTAGNITGIKNCPDSVTLNYNLKNISGSFTAYDDYVYTSITDTSFFEIKGGILREADDLETRLAQLGNATSVIFCRTGSTDYLNKKCTLCANTNCYSDIIPELIEFIGPGCSVEGMNCSGTPSITADYARFIPNNGDYAAFDNLFSWVTTATGKPVHWLIESNYNTNIAATRSPSSIFKPASTEGFIVKTSTGNPFDDISDYICDVDAGLDSRFIKEHNVCYVYLDNGQIKLSKNLIKNPGYNDQYTDTIKIHPDTQVWDCGNGGELQFNYYSSDTGSGSDIDIFCGDTNTHEELVLPKLNVNGYRPTVVISDIILKGKASEADIKGLTLYFKPWGSRFKSQNKLQDNVSDNNLNIKILDLDVSATGIEDITKKYITPSDGLDMFVPPTVTSNYYSVINPVDPSDEPELKDYCFIRIVKQTDSSKETPLQFLNRIGNGKIKLLFNVNDSQIPLENIAEELYNVKYKKYEPSFTGCGGPTDWLYYVFTTYGFEFNLADFSIAGIPELVEDGKNLARVDIQTKKINGLCINIDCTDMSEMCSSLEGC